MTPLAKQMDVEILKLNRETVRVMGSVRYPGYILPFDAITLGNF